MTDDSTATLESALTAEVARMYEEVAGNPAIGWWIWAECFGLLEAAGFKRIRSRGVAGLEFRKPATQDAAEQFGATSVVFTATRPAA
jgi:hypothetical protein